MVFPKEMSFNRRACRPVRHLFAAVEDGAVAGGAEHILVQGSLASLALRPQRGKLLLQLVHRAQRPLVNLHLLHGSPRNRDFRVTPYA